MRQKAKTAVLAVIMVTTGAVLTALQPAPASHLNASRQPQFGSLAAPIEAFANWSEPTSIGDAYVGTVPQSASFEYPPQFVSYGYEARPELPSNPLQYPPLGDLLPTKPGIEAQQNAPIGPPDVRKSDRLPRQLKPRVVRIQFSAPVLAPMAHTLFCLHYPDECRVRKVVFRGGPFKLTDERRAELEHVNAEVNRTITWKRDTEWLAGKGWLISPKFGDCNVFAVTKRHELLALGWPERALLLSEVVTSGGEHHLVLVVRTSEGDLVADSLDQNIRSWEKTSYQWVRIQSPASPKSWSTVATVTG